MRRVIHFKSHTRLRKGKKLEVVVHWPEHQEIMQQLLVIIMTKAKLPSGTKKVVSSSARGTVGIVSGGGHIDKTMLKAGRAYHRYRVKRNSWPKTRGVAIS
ncbi:5029_t:CDS:2 [Entrophospora sp. SA101]|nr:6545_t:CDS:2 [Entrophospora sp. SA101]CAJ0906476.1 5029_t:CDS:2 [Entrophospora sp. SA101]